MIEPSLCRRVEEASLNAWPALQQSLLDGWVLRFSRGFTKRANSIVPVYPSQQAAIEKIRYCENLYSRERLKTIFRLTTVVDSDSLDAAARAARLSARRSDARAGARARWHLVRDEADLSRSSPRRVARSVCSAADVPPAGMQLHALLLAGIRSEHVFGFISVDRVPVACGIAVLERELVGLFDIVTHACRATARSRSARWSNRCSRWGRNAAPVMPTCRSSKRTSRHARCSDQLGFEDLYSYWYRVAP